MFVIFVTPVFILLFLFWREEQRLHFEIEIFLMEPRRMKKKNRKQHFPKKVFTVKSKLRTMYDDHIYSKVNKKKDMNNLTDSKFRKWNLSIFQFVDSISGSFSKIISSKMPIKIILIHSNLFLTQKFLISKLHEFLKVI